MKRLVITLVAFLLLFSTTQSVKADWVLKITSDGYVVLVWDPAFPVPTTPPPPPTNLPGSFIEVLMNGLWYIFGGGVIQ